MVGSHIIVVPKLQYKSGLKQIMEKMAEKFVSGLNEKMNHLLLEHKCSDIHYMVRYGTSGKRSENPTLFIGHPQKLKIFLSPSPREI